MPNPSINRLLAGTFAVCVSFLAAAPAMADDAMTQVKRSNDLTTLVYKASASACMVNAGIDADVEMKALALSRVQFIVTLQNLAADAAPGQLEAVESAWQPLDEAFSMILAGDAPAGYVATINQSRPALENAAVLLADEAALQPEVAAQMSTAELLAASLAARQEVLVHQMKLLACQIGDGTASEDDRMALSDVMTHYERSLAVLAEGRPDLGIVAPTDYAVSQVLAAAGFDWQITKPMLTEIVENGAATEQELRGIRARAGGLDTRMAELADGYLVPTVSGDQPRVAVLHQSTN